MIHEKLNFINFYSHFMKFKFDARRGSYEYFPMVTCLRLKSGACKYPNFFGPYLRKCSKPSSNFFKVSSSRFQIHVVTILAYEPLYKQSYSEKSKMSCLQQ